jgi:hypothetical protein
MKFQQWEPDLVTLVSRMDAGEIDLQPDFQRQEVWPIPKRRKLIDTILREWSMPPIHLIESGKAVLEVLDGQQRLAAIRDFLHDEITVDGTIAPQNSYIQKLHGLKYSKLPEDAKRRIDRYTVRAFRVSDFSPEEPSELFYRLNQPTLLTAGEQRNSLYGPARSQLKELVGHFQMNNDQETIGFSNVRLAYDDVIARLLFFFTAGGISVKATEGQISDMFRNKAGFSDESMTHAYDTLTQFSRARVSYGKCKLNKASLLSWLIFYSRGEESAERYEFFSYFLALNGIRDGLHIGSASRELFNDRASARVTDISSVYLRDVSLWLAFVTAYDASAFSEYATSCCKIVSSLFDEDDFTDLEYHINNVVSVETWSKIA